MLNQYLSELVNVHRMNNGLTRQRAKQRQRTLALFFHRPQGPLTPGHFRIPCRAYRDSQGLASFQTNSIQTLNKGALGAQTAGCSASD